TSPRRTVTPGGRFFFFGLASDGYNTYGGIPPEGEMHCKSGPFAMDDDSYDLDRLSRIQTMWSMVQQAHRPDATRFAGAQQQMLDRYGGAVRRYALAALRDP